MLPSTLCHASQGAYIGVVERVVWRGRGSKETFEQTFEQTFPQWFQEKA
jgi:hypothetical protein